MSDGALHDKFRVSRTDGTDAPGGRHDGCEYFVIDVTHDEHARRALAAYADACAVNRPKLAASMRQRWGLTDGRWRPLSEVLDPASLLDPKDQTP